MRCKTSSIRSFQRGRCLLASYNRWVDKWCEGKSGRKRPSQKIYVDLTEAASKEDVTSSPPYQDPNYNPDDDELSFNNKFDPEDVVNVDKDMHVEAVIDLGCITFSHFYIFTLLCVLCF